jgi:hypothetical protein
MGYSNRYDDDGGDIYEEDDDNELLKKFSMPPDLDEKRIVLQIIDAGGNIEDILIDIEEIYKYVRNVYKKCPNRN